MSMPAKYLVPVFFVLEYLFQVLFFIREYLNFQWVWIHVRLKGYYCYRKEFNPSAHIQLMNVENFLNSMIWLCAIYLRIIGSI